MDKSSESSIGEGNAIEELNGIHGSGTLSGVPTLSDSLDEAGISSSEDLDGGGLMHESTQSVNLTDLEEAAEAELNANQANELSFSRFSIPPYEDVDDDLLIAEGVSPFMTHSMLQEFRDLETQVFGNLCPLSSSTVEGTEETLANYLSRQASHPATENVLQVCLRDSNVKVEEDSKFNPSSTSCGAIRTETRVSQYQHHPGNCLLSEDDGGNSFSASSSSKVSSTEGKHNDLEVVTAHQPRPECQVDPISLHDQVLAQWVSDSQHETHIMSSKKNVNMSAAPESGSRHVSFGQHLHDTSENDSISPRTDATTAGSPSCTQLQEELQREIQLRQEKEQYIEQLQRYYDTLLAKHAMAELTIDNLRLGAHVNITTTRHRNIHQQSPAAVESEPHHPNAFVFQESSREPSEDKILSAIRARTESLQQQVEQMTESQNAMSTSSGVTRMQELRHEYNSLQSDFSTLCRNDTSGGGKRAELQHEVEGKLFHVGMCLDEVDGMICRRPGGSTTNVSSAPIVVASEEVRRELTTVGDEPRVDDAHHRTTTSKAVQTLCNLVEVNTRAKCERQDAATPSGNRTSDVKDMATTILPKRPTSLISPHVETVPHPHNSRLSPMRHLPLQRLSPDVLSDSGFVTLRTLPSDSPCLSRGGGTLTTAVIVPNLDKGEEDLHSRYGIHTSSPSASSYVPVKLTYKSLSLPTASAAATVAANSITSNALTLQETPPKSHIPTGITSTPAVNTVGDALHMRRERMQNLQEEIRQLREKVFQESQQGAASVADQNHRVTTRMPPSGPSTPRQSQEGYTSRKTVRGHKQQAMSPGVDFSPRSLDACSTLKSFPPQAVYKLEDVPHSSITIAPQQRLLPTTGMDGGSALLTGSSLITRNVLRNATGIGDKESTTPHMPTLSKQHQRRRGERTQGSRHLKLGMESESSDSMEHMEYARRISRRQHHVPPNTPGTTMEDGMWQHREQVPMVSPGTPRYDVPTVAPRSYTRDPLIPAASPRENRGQLGRLPSTIGRRATPVTPRSSDEYDERVCRMPVGEVHDLGVYSYSSGECESAGNMTVHYHVRELTACGPSAAPLEERREVTHEGCPCCCHPRYELTWGPPHARSGCPCCCHLGSVSHCREDRPHYAGTCMKRRNMQDMQHWQSPEMSREHLRDKLCDTLAMVSRVAERVSMDLRVPPTHPYCYGRPPY